MANNQWSGLGLGGDMGGFGRVDVRGATPPIGNTGPGGVEGMGLLALLRRLSMGLDDGKELPEPMSPDPMSSHGMAATLGSPPAKPMMDPGFPQMQPTGTSMSPEQQRIAYEEEMRRLGMPGF